MIAKPWRVLLLLASVLPLLSCSGLKNGNGIGGKGNALVSVTLYDTPPTGLDLLSFTLPISDLSLVSSTGNTVSLNIVNSSVEATRLQTDSALLVSSSSVAAGTYTSLSVTFGATSASSNIFINTTGSTITWTTGTGGSCANGGVCFLPAGAGATISIPVDVTLSANESQWIGLNLNLGNAITNAGGLAVDFTQANVLTGTTSPRTGLPSGAVDTIEDFTGTVTSYTSGSSITVQNAITGQKITAALNTSTEYDAPLPTGNSYDGCGASSNQSCVAVGSTVSMDVTLSATGVLTATEVDVLDATATTEVEGVIYPTTTANVYGLILADKIADKNSVISSSSTTYGTPIFLNVGSVSNWVVDTKTLSSTFTDAPNSFGNSSQLLAGQRIRAQVSNVVSSNSGITATATNVLLRFSRMSGTVAGPGATSFLFTPPNYISALNSQLGAPPYTAFTFSSTIYDGTTAGNIPAGTAGIRTLLLDNTQPTLGVAKVRVP
jgi:hypothetical protein